jgi:hypothetical protein
MTQCPKLRSYLTRYQYWLIKTRLSKHSRTTTKCRQWRQTLYPTRWMCRFLHWIRWHKGFLDLREHSWSTTNTPHPWDISTWYHLRLMWTRIHTWKLDQKMDQSKGRKYGNYAHLWIVSANRETMQSRFYCHEFCRGRWSDF